MRCLALAALLLVPAPGLAQAPAPAAQPADEAARMRADALGVEALINQVYAYPERLPGGRFTLTPIFAPRPSGSPTAARCCASPSGR